MAASVTAVVGIGDSTAPAATLETGTLTPTGVNKVIYALVGSGAGSPSDPSPVKYASTVGVGGESLTLLDSVRLVPTNNNIKTSVWRLANPSAGSGTIHATYGGLDDERWIIAVAVQDAAGTEGTITYATGAATGSATASAASTAGELILDFLSVLRPGGGNWVLTCDASQTSVKELEGNSPGTGGTGNIGQYEAAGVSSEVASGASTVMSWTFSAGSGEYGLHAFQVNPFVGGGSTFPPVPQPRTSLATLLTM